MTFAEPRRSKPIHVTYSPIKGACYGRYAITFRIEDKATQFDDYDDRYLSLDAAIKIIAIDGRYWAKAISFYIIESSHNNTSGLVKQISIESMIDESVHLLAVFNQSIRGYTKIGNLLDGDVDVIMNTG